MNSGINQFFQREAKNLAFGDRRGVSLMRTNILKMIQFIANTITLAYLTVLLIHLAMRFILRDRFWWSGFFNNFTPFAFFPLVIFFPLAIVLRSRRTLLAQLPFALMAGIMVIPIFVPDLGFNLRASASASTLKIITFNMHRNMPALMNPWVLDQDADIVLVQEVPNSSGYFRLTPKLSSIYPYFASHTAWTRAGGNAILSKYELISVEDLQIDPNNVRSTQQRIVINFNGQDIAIYNVHLASVTRDRPRIRIRATGFIDLALRYDATERDKQIRWLINTLKNEKLPFIVAGDFNMSDQMAIYHDVAAVMNDSFRQAGIGLGTTWPVGEEATSVPDLLPAFVRIDYIWHSDHFRAVKAAVGPNLGSDHLPVFGELEWVGSE